MSIIVNKLAFAGICSPTGMRKGGFELVSVAEPVAALKPLIEAFTQQGNIVLDPFCGSGSTPLAAKILKRNYLGIELEVLM